MGKATEDPKNSKRNLLDDSDSESEDGGAAVAGPDFKVNEDFARRFEHNKKREERQRLEEKFKKTGKQPEADDDESSSSDEEEDEDGFLATEDLDAQISATLQAIRNKDPKVYDKDVTFYKPDDPTATATDKEKKEKPVYLKDYHREKYLRGDTGAEDQDEDTPMTYNQEQDALKKSIVAEMHAAAAESDSSEDEDGGFIKRKEPAKVDSSGVHPSRKVAVAITEVDVANADKNPENFLSNFMSARAWVPPDGSNWKAFESDDGEDDDDRADEFEQAYNLRFEDPERSNEFLRSYARDVAAAKSVRREEKSGRKRQRELEKERKEAEKRERREEKARLRKLKLDEAQEKLRKIKHAAGSAGKDLTDEDWIKFLDDAWEDDKWEEEMKKRFGDDYYAQEDDAPVSDDEEEDGGKKKSKQPKKPKWDDDIDIKDIIPDFEEDGEKPKIGLDDVEDDGAEEAEDDDEDGRPSKKRKTDHKKARKESQKQARQERAKLEALVDSKLELSEHALLKQPSHAPFRYRETSPQSFGMTARDILLAPSDADLNDYAGLKKLATYRDQEKKRKDKKRLGKKARLRQWRRDIFGKEFEREGPTYGFERLITADDEADGTVIEPKGDRSKKHKKDDGKDGNVVGDVGDVGERKKKRKRSKGNKSASAAVVAEE
ncbi:hypothetical protein F66182_6923 [Fusarium sp. NRRL 66182]|nr:hypothetical protein F66182_6923 [Fusarium sp. NRRL 66182]